MARLVNRSLNSNWVNLIWDVYQDTTKENDVFVLKATSSATFQQLGRWIAQIKKGDASSVEIEVTLDPYELAKNDLGEVADMCTWISVGSDTDTDRIEFHSPLTAIRVKFTGSGSVPAKATIAVV